jgi:hypothetical protein
VNSEGGTEDTSQYSSTDPEAGQESAREILRRTRQNPRPSNRDPSSQRSQGRASGLVRAEDVYEDFETSVSELAAALGNRRGPRVFSELAIKALATQQANFLEDMGLEAINLARRNQVDVVSAADVRAAEASLRSHRPSFASRLMDLVGSLLAAAGVTQLYSVVSATKASPPSNLAILLAFISTTIGTGLLAFGLRRR